LKANADHPIEHYLQDYKHYSRNLARIAKLIETTYSKFDIVDVGANIGDTIALIRSAGVDQPIYCVEGEPTYYQLLGENAAQFKNVHLIDCFVGEVSGPANFSINSSEGTAKLDTSNPLAVELKTLDEIVQREKIDQLKLLKIDTDGFDLKVIRGGWQTISKQRPVIFFEYDAILLKEQGDDGLKIFDELAAQGYDTSLFYDNYGKLLLSTTLSESGLIHQLHHYISSKDAAFQYFDICAFHRQDTELAQLVKEKEAAFFRNGK
jgi:FkbM family methyltransferase